MVVGFRGIYLLVILAAAQLAMGQTTDLSAAGQNGHYGDASSPAIPRTVYWGDTHLHTGYSPDADLGGNASLDPAAAYRFARQQENSNEH